MEFILENIKKYRFKKVIKNILFFLGLGFITLLCIIDEESDMLVTGIIFFGIPAFIFLILALRHLVSSFNPQENNMFYRLNKIGNYKEICNYFNKQIQNKLFEDEKVIITKDLFIKKENFEDTFLNSEILDITHLINKVNGIIDFVSITIFYSDGKKYEIKYKRPLGISNMEQKAENVLTIAHILASNCENLRSRKKN